MPDVTGPAAGDSSFDELLARLLAGQRSTPFGRPVDLSRLLSRRTREVLGEAGKLAADNGHTEVDALHVLRVLVAQPPATDVLRAAGTEPEAFARSVEDALPGRSEPTGTRPPLTTAAQRVLLEAAQIARASGSTYIDPEHLFLAFVDDGATPTGRLLARAGVTRESLQAGSRDGARARTGEPAGAAGGSDTPTLDQYGTDLTALAREGKLDPVVGRVEEVAQTVEILLRRTKNNPVLIGEPGVGKTAVVEGLAQRVADGDVPEMLRGRRIVALDLTGMVAGTRYRGDFEERITKLVDEVVSHRDEVILFLDEIHTVVGAGGSGGEGGMDAGNILKPRLARGELHLIGATTLTEYRRIEKDAALERRFQPVTVAEPSTTDAVAILSGLKGRYEEHHGVTYTDEAITAAVELSARYVTARFLPDKAIDLIDQAGARRRLLLAATPDVAALRARVAELESAKAAAVAAERYEEASRLRDEVSAAEQRLAAAGTDSAGTDSGQAAVHEVVAAVVGEAEIAEMVSRTTGIPVTRLTAGDRGKLAGLEGDLRQRVIGQDDAVRAVARAVRRSRTGMGDPHRPVGSFLFLGPTGVGKTELAKSLAATLFGDESAMVRFDMSEFSERHTVSRLVGSPPGYVGYDEAGQLTERVRRQPYSVLLLDEIEKAHPDVFNLLLQVLDDGRLTDAQGRTVDFRNTVVVMTSNLGSEILASRSGALGFVGGGAVAGASSEKDLRDRVWAKLREAMRPEFLNRIDEVVLFRKLDREQLHAIVELVLAGTRGRLDAQGIGLDVDAASVDWLADHGWQPEYGARPLRRLVQREVEDRIADLLVSAEPVAGDRIAVRVDGEHLLAVPEPDGLPLAA